MSLQTLDDVHAELRRAGWGRECILAAGSSYADVADGGEHELLCFGLAPDGYKGAVLDELIAHLPGGSNPPLDGDMPCDCAIVR
jgi:hypothetical protein